MIQFIILLAISPVLIPMLAVVFAIAGMLVGLWFGAFLTVGIFQLFLYGWSSELAPSSRYCNGIALH